MPSPRRPPVPASAAASRAVPALTPACSTALTRHGLPPLDAAGIRHTRARFLRRHASCSTEDQLRDKLRAITRPRQRVSAGSPTEAARAIVKQASANRKASLLGQDFMRADANQDGVIDADEYMSMQAKARARVSRVAAAGDSGHGGAVNLFDTAAHKVIKRQKSEQVRRAQFRLADGVWVGGSPELFKHALGVLRIVEAFYVALVLLNGIATAVMILGPRCWWLLLLLVTPILFSAQLAVLIVRDFALLYAVCKPNVDTLMIVEHDSSVIQRTCEELRGQFQSMFVRAHPDMPRTEILEACDRAFVELDVDGTGTLTRKEFAELIKQLTGHVASKKMLHKLLRIVDADVSGCVCIEEFLQFVAVLDDGQGPLDVAELELKVTLPSTLRAHHPHAPERPRRRRPARCVPHVERLRPASCHVVWLRGACARAPSQVESMVQAHRARREAATGRASPPVGSSKPLPKPAKSAMKQAAPDGDTTTAKGRESNASGPSTRGPSSSSSSTGGNTWAPLEV